MSVCVCADDYVDGSGSEGQGPPPCVCGDAGFHCGYGGVSLLELLWGVRGGVLKVSCVHWSFMTSVVFWLCRGKIHSQR